MHVRLILTVVLLACLAAGGCAGGGGGVANASIDGPIFPAEKTAADFPGLAYAAFDDNLQRPRGRVWLIGIDGATWDLIEPWAAEGHLPNFTRLMREGAWATLQSEEPTLSPALWATVATGVPRHVHGMANFVERRQGSHQTRTAGPLDRRVPALWDLVGAAGGRSAVLGWFNSFPAEAIEGHYVSKHFDPADPQPRRIHPPALAAALTGSFVAPYEARHLAQVAPTRTLMETAVSDANTLGALQVVAGLDDHDLIAVHFSAVDVAQHLAWRDMDPASQAFPQDGPARPVLASVIRRTYQMMDHALGQVLRWLPQDATVIVLSDHGGGPMRLEHAYHLQLDVLLTSMGLMDGSRGTAFAIDESYRNDKRIWLNLAGVDPEGTVAPAEAAAVGARLAERLRAMRTDAGTPLFARVDDCVSLPDWKPGDPALMVRFSDDALPTATVTDGDRVLPFDPVRLRHTDVSGGHRPEGVLIVRGAGFTPGRVDEDANLYQIAPTVLHLLGLPQDARMLAHAPQQGGVWPPALQRRAAPRMIAAYPGPAADWRDPSSALASTAPAGTGAAVDDRPDAVEEEHRERLRSLGYLR